EDADEPPNPVVGGELWAGQQQKADPRFGAEVLSVVHDLETEPTLTTQLDPAQNNAATYVDAALVQRMHQWIEEEYLGQGNALTYALGSVESPCAQHTAKDT